jgi:hypothetical protein
METETAADRAGELIDRLDNLAHALQLPVPATTHVEQLRKALPDVVRKAKDLYAEITGYDPWEQGEEE